MASRGNYEGERAERHGGADRPEYGYQDSTYEQHSGDPRRDLEHDQYPATYIVPVEIRKFLTHFKAVIEDQDLYQIQDAYENGFNMLTDRYFKNTAWPTAEDISKIVQDDVLFLILYKEMYFRHIYARVQNGPTVDQMIDSYCNYCDLFNIFIPTDPNNTRPIQLELPNQWLWNIIDEFIYQFQAFSQFRSKLQQKSEEEIEIFRNNPKIWNVHSVLNVLHTLVDKSNINRQLEVYTSGGDPDSVAGEFGRRNLYKMLGYFGLIGLLRLHSLLADYHQALHVLVNIDFNKGNVFSRVSACQITTYYYVGFAYMMMRRYQDAIKTFSSILLYMQRTKQMFQNKAQLYDQFKKQNDQMHQLLAICLALHPMKIDESVHHQLKDGFKDKILKLANGDLNEFSMMFSFACPKFLSPVPPNYENRVNYHKDPYDLQLKVFIDEVQQQRQLSTIRSYLKLYTTLPISQLADYMGIKDSELRMALMCFKHKMRNMVWAGGSSGLENGSFQTGSDVDFYIDEDMIHIADTKVASRYGDYFIRQIHKFDELQKRLVALPGPGSAAVPK